MSKKPENGAPTLGETFTETIRLGLDTHGWRSLVPWKVFFAVALPLWFAMHWHEEMTAWLRISGVVTIVSAVMVIGGLLSSVCINILRETYSLTADKPFATFLKEQGLFDQYLFWPQFVLLMQLSLVVYCLLVIALIIIAPSWQVTPYMTAMSFGFLIYVAIKTFDLVDMVNQVLLAPVPWEHLESAETIPHLGECVAFGSSSRSLANLPLGIPVFIYGSNPRHIRFRPRMVTWRGTLGAVLPAVKSGVRSGKHSNPLLRPPSAERDDGPFEMFFEVMNWRQLSTPRTLSEFTKIGGKGKPFTGDVPQWPTLAELDC